LNKEVLEKLCKEYGFSFSIMGKYIQIVSKRDTYYILDMNHEGRRIKLFHQNIYASAGFHKHGEHESLKNIFASIFSHDNIYNVGSRNNKLTRMTELFNQLHNTPA